MEPQQAQEAKETKKETAKAAAETVKKKDFVEIQFSGYANGQLFDSNIEADLKKLNPEAKAEKIIVAVGEGMLVSGFDKALEGKEIGKEYEVTVLAKNGFGERKKEMIKTIPLKVFHAHKLDPKPGMVFSMDYSIAKVIAISGARVITDFNNPLAGKALDYKFKIIRKVSDDKEKADSLFLFYLKLIPPYEIKDKIIARGPKPLELFVNAYKGKFKELLGKELVFEEAKPEKPELKPQEKPEIKQEAPKEAKPEKPKENQEKPEAKPARKIEQATN